MKLKFFLIFFVILVMVSVGCTKQTEPKQIVIVPEKQPTAEKPQEIVQQTPAPQQVPAEQTSQNSTVPTQTPQQQPSQEEKPLPKATVTEQFSQIYTGSVDLKHFPTIFVALDKDNQKVFNGLLVVGKKAPVSDVIAAQNVAVGLNNGIRRPGYIISAVLDTQVDDITKQNAIVIGNPCDNTAAALLLGNTECNANLQTGKGLIKVYENNGFIQMVVVGYDAAGTLKASEYLKEYYMYDWVGTRYEFSY